MIQTSPSETLRSFAFNQDQDPRKNVSELLDDISVNQPSSFEEILKHYHKSTVLTDQTDIINKTSSFFASQERSDPTSPETTTKIDPDLHPSFRRFLVSSDGTGKTTHLRYHYLKALHTEKNRLSNFLAHPQNSGYIAYTPILLTITTPAYLLLTEQSLDIINLINLSSGIPYDNEYLKNQLDAGRCLLFTTTIVILEIAPSDFKPLARCPTIIPAALISHYFDAFAVTSANSFTTFSFLLQEPNPSQAATSPQPSTLPHFLSLLVDDFLSKKTRCQSTPSRAPLLSLSAEDRLPISLPFIDRQLPQFWRTSAGPIPSPGQRYTTPLNQNTPLRLSSPPLTTLLSSLILSDDPTIDFLTHLAYTITSQHKTQIDVKLLVKEITRTSASSRVWTKLLREMNTPHSLIECHFGRITPTDLFSSPKQTSTQSVSSTQTVTGSPSQPQPPPSLHIPLLRIPVDAQNTMRYSPKTKLTTYYPLSVQLVSPALTLPPLHVNEQEDIVFQSRRMEHALKRGEQLFGRMDKKRTRHPLHRRARSFSFFHQSPFEPTPPPSINRTDSVNSFGAEDSQSVLSAVTPSMFENNTSIFLHRFALSQPSREFTSLPTRPYTSFGMSALQQCVSAVATKPNLTGQTNTLGSSASHTQNTSISPLDTLYTPLHTHSTFSFRHITIQLLLTALYHVRLFYARVGAVLMDPARKTRKQGNKSLTNESVITSAILHSQMLRSAQNWMDPFVSQSLVLALSLLPSAAFKHFQTLFVLSMIAKDGSTQISRHHPSLFSSSLNTQTTIPIKFGLSVLFLVQHAFIRSYSLTGHTIPSIRNTVNRAWWIEPLLLAYPSHRLAALQHINIQLKTEHASVQKHGKTDSMDAVLTDASLLLYLALLDDIEEKRRVCVQLKRTSLLSLDGVVKDASAPQLLKLMQMEGEDVLEFFSLNFEDKTQIKPTPAAAKKRIESEDDEDQANPLPPMVFSGIAESESDSSDSVSFSSSEDEGIFVDIPRRVPVMHALPSATTLTNMTSEESALTLFSHLNSPRSAAGEDWLQQVNLRQGVSAPAKPDPPVPRHIRVQVLSALSSVSAMIATELAEWKGPVPFTAVASLLDSFSRLTSVSRVEMKVLAVFTSHHPSLASLSRITLEQLLIHPQSKVKTTRNLVSLLLHSQPSQLIPLLSTLSQLTVTAPMLLDVISFLFGTLLENSTLILRQHSSHPPPIRHKNDKTQSNSLMSFLKRRNKTSKTASPTDETRRAVTESLPHPRLTVESPFNLDSDPIPFPHNHLFVVSNENVDEGVGVVEVMSRSHCSDEHVQFPTPKSPFHSTLLSLIFSFNALVSSTLNSIHPLSPPRRPLTPSQSLTRILSQYIPPTVPVTSLHPSPNTLLPPPILNTLLSSHNPTKTRAEVLFPLCSSPIDLLTHLPPSSLPPQSTLTLAQPHQRIKPTSSVPSSPMSPLPHSDSAASIPSQFTDTPQRRASPFDPIAVLLSHTFSILRFQLPFLTFFACRAVQLITPLIPSHLICPLIACLFHISTPPNINTALFNSCQSNDAKTPPFAAVLSYDTNFRSSKGKTTALFKSHLPMTAEGPPTPPAPTDARMHYAPTAVVREALLALFVLLSNHPIFARFFPTVTEVFSEQETTYSPNSLTLPLSHFNAFVALTNTLASSAVVQPPTHRIAWSSDHVSHWPSSEVAQLFSHPILASTIDSFISRHPISQSRNLAQSPSSSPSLTSEPSPLSSPTIRMIPFEAPLNTPYSPQLDDALVFSAGLSTLCTFWLAETCVPAALHTTSVLLLNSIGMKSISEQYARHASDYISFFGENEDWPTKLDEVVQTFDLPSCILHTVKVMSMFNQDFGGSQKRVMELANTSVTRLGKGEGGNGSVGGESEEEDDELSLEANWTDLTTAFTQQALLKQIEEKTGKTRKRKEQRPRPFAQKKQDSTETGQKQQNRQIKPCCVDFVKSVLQTPLCSVHETSLFWDDSVSQSLLNQSSFSLPSLLSETDNVLTANAAVSFGRGGQQPEWQRLPSSVIPFANSPSLTINWGRSSIMESSVFLTPKSIPSFDESEVNGTIVEFAEDPQPRVPIVTPQSFHSPSLHVHVLQDRTANTISHLKFCKHLTPSRTLLPILVAIESLSALVRITIREVQTSNTIATLIPTLEYLAILAMHPQQSLDMSHTSTDLIPTTPVHPLVQFAAVSLLRSLISSLPHSILRSITIPFAVGTCVSNASYFERMNKSLLAAEWIALSPFAVSKMDTAEEDQSELSSCFSSLLSFTQSSASLRTLITTSTSLSKSTHTDQIIPTTLVASSLYTALLVFLSILHDDHSLLVSQPWKSRHIPSLLMEYTMSCVESPSTSLFTPPYTTSFTSLILLLIQSQNPQILALNSALFGVLAVVLPTQTYSTLLLSRLICLEGAARDHLIFFIHSFNTQPNPTLQRNLSLHHFSTVAETSSSTVHSLLLLLDDCALLDPPNPNFLTHTTSLISSTPPLFRESIVAFLPTLQIAPDTTWPILSEIIERTRQVYPHLTLPFNLVDSLQSRLDGFDLTRLPQTQELSQLGDCAPSAFILSPPSHFAISALLSQCLRVGDSKKSPLPPIDYLEQQNTVAVKVLSSFSTLLDSAVRVVLRQTMSDNSEPAQVVSQSVADSPALSHLSLTTQPHLKPTIEIFVHSFLWTNMIKTKPVPQLLLFRLINTSTKVSQALIKPKTPFPSGSPVGHGETGQRSEGDEEGELDSAFSSLVSRLEPHFTTIKHDISRTFAHSSSIILSVRQMNITSLVLKMWVTNNPIPGYVQGMSYLAAIASIPGDIPNAYRMLDAILSTPFFTKLYAVNVKFREDMFELFDAMLQKCETPIHTLLHTLHQEGSLPFDFLFSWFSTFFSRSFPVSISFIALDGFFFEGPIFLFRAAIALVSLLLPHAPIPSKTQDDGALFALVTSKLNGINSFHNSVTPTLFVQTLTQVHFPSRTFFWEL
ncbi:putative Rab-GTPase-TBC domain containing protein [Blattamonas nauphoetae]|uniref:Rab-GTPase-TBC domain containing protein n=1 Tax=Blattamonas nauphoetae TaxID=2049346 RepID=A0ABQ9XTV4_9EUKA|nr:putative Rab-GTPase-TBC domain containing protein [Blattamonas nauphoetae]